MSYRFTRTWCRGSVGVGTGVIVVALLLAVWLGFSSEPELERFAKKHDGGTRSCFEREFGQFR